MLGAWLLAASLSASAQSKYYLTAGGGFSLGFIYNHGVGITSNTHKGDPAIGKGFQSELGIGKTFRGQRYSVEAGFGTYDMSNPTDPFLLGLNLGKRPFTYELKFYSGALRVAYRIDAPRKKCYVELVLGSTFLFNRPATTYADNTWVYPDFSVWYNSEDLQSARYKAQESYNTQWALLFNGGLRLNYPVTRKVQFTALLYYEQAFTTIRSVLYSSERQYYNNPDLNYQVLSVFSGDAIGLKLGVKYDLKR